MKHLSLAKQLSISFSFIGLVLIGTFTTVYYKVQVLNSDAVSVQNLRIPTSLASQQLQKGIHQSLAALRGWTSLNDDQFKLERNLAWQQEIWQPLNKLNRLSANWTNPANITRLARIEKNILKLEEYQQAVENIANTLDSTPALKILIQDAAPLATRMLKNISDLIEIEAAMPAKADRGRLFKQFADFRGSFSLGIAEISLFLLSQQQQHKSLFDEHWLANEQLLGVIEGSLFLLTTEQKTLFIELLSEWKKFRLLPEKIFQIQQSEVNNLAKFWLGTKAAPEAVKILNDLDKITLDQKRDLRLGFIEHEKLINRLYLNLAILLGVSLILLIGVGSYLVREITIPVNQAILIAQEVGKGNTSIDINLTGAEEIRVLGAALKKMSVELTEASSQKGRQYWVAESLREINDIVQGQTDIEKMASATCLYLAAHLNLQTLHFYINDGVSLRLVGSYPLDDSDASKNKTAFGVETVDHGVLEGFPISPINVPSSYTRINSETSPCHIVVAPFTVGNEVYGVMEIGTSEPLSEVEIELLDLLDKRIGIVIRSIFKQTKTQNLLLKSQTYSDELQQEELRVTNVELQERTKGLQTSEEDLRAQTEELQIINVELQEKSELLGKQYTEAEQARQMIRIEAEKLERVSRYKSEFLANMSHELRTPLNSLLILSKLLSDNKNGNLTEKQVEFAATIYNSGNDLLTIIGDILDLSKVEAGKLDINIENIDIPALVKKISVNLKPLFKQKNLKFKIIVETNCPQTIQTDAGRLEQIIKNLLSNAQKFTDKGRVTLTVGRPLKSIILTRNNLRPQGCIAFSIVDTGIGIPADKQALIFDAFQQVDSGTTRKYGGTGLGLSITRELVNLLHGEIQVTSVEGKGSTFTIFLNETASQDNVMASGPVEASITHQLTNQTIKPEGQVDTDEEISVLIFKGDPVLGRSVIEVISSDRIKVDMVEIADNAFELLQDEKIDCLIIDLEFKGSMDGFEFLEKIHQKNLTIPHTIIYTGKDLTTSEESRLKKLAVSILITGSGAPEKLLAEMMRFAGIEDKDLSVYQSEIIQKISLAKDIFENKTILLVDDDTRNLFALSSALEQYDMKVVMAKNGRECIEELNSNDTIDLVLMDIMMPEMDGFEAMEILRRDSRFKTLPIIALTAKAMKGDMEKCLKAGASDYLGKPVQVDSLLSLIEDWLTK